MTFIPYLIAVVLAAFSVTFEFTLRPGQIFGQYGDWLETKKEWWTKPIGGCMICTNIWLNFMAMVVYGCLMDVHGWEWLIVVSAPFISNALYRIADKNVQ